MAHRDIGGHDGRLRLTVAVAGFAMIVTGLLLAGKLSDLPRHTGGQTPSAVRVGCEADRVDGRRPAGPGRTQDPPRRFLPRNVEEQPSFPVSLRKAHPSIRRAPAVVKIAPIFRAIEEVEGCDPDNPYQISADYWREGCEFGGMDLDYDEHVDSRPHSRWVMIHYWQRYGAATDEARARMHRAGPSGMDSEMADAYWVRVDRLIAVLR